MRSLIVGLPRESRFVCARLPNGSWTNTEELLAQLVEEQSVLIRLFHTAYFKPPHPDIRHVPRPGDGEAEKTPKSKAAEMKAFFGGAVRYTKGSS